jgi:CubicO group peptidase (beta-lactamase class C family)
MNDHIFKPLGMTHTFAMPNSQRLSGANVAASYYFEDGEPWAYEPDPLDMLSGSGSIYSTVGDMFLFDQALYADVLISQETLAEAFVSGVLNNGKDTEYGFALDLGEYAGETYAAHSGAWLGFESYYLRFPERNLSVVILLNFDYLETGAEGLAFEIADIYLR